jgi:hypothetical protein
MRWTNSSAAAIAVEVGTGTAGRLQFLEYSHAKKMMIAIRIANSERRRTIRFFGDQSDTIWKYSQPLCRPKAAARIDPYCVLRARR